MKNLNGKIALITGGAGNLGRATARAFVGAGASTVIVDRASGRLQEIYADLVNSEDHLLAEGIDITDAAAVEGLVERAHSRFGRIDILVNTVGTYRGGSPVHEEEIETWDLLLNANLKTTLLMCRTLVPVMQKEGGGRIVNVAARAALAGGANAAAYSASKSAVVRLTESLAAELKDSGINVNCVLPGTIDTAKNREAMPNTDFTRWVTPEAIADVILFLASDEARAVSGAAVPVFGAS